MKKILFILLFPLPALSATFKDDPYEVFDVSKRERSAVQLMVYSDGDVATRCQKESRKRHLGGFPYRVEACSFWNEDSGLKCSIYLPTLTNMHQLGHEVRHCLAGAWHK